jgi:CHAT domain-containing protein/tetratricopeptide (TPR) repeat protein
MTLPPEPISRLGGSGDARLLRAIRYWLGVGKEYEARAWPAIVAARRRDLVFRTTSLADVLYLSFENRRDFNDTDLQAWTNIALATAASGNYKGGAEIFDGIIEIVERQWSPDSDYSALESMETDATALWIQHAETQDDIQPLLDRLQRIDSTTLSLRIEELRRGSQSYRDNYAAAEFNQGLILEELGLYGAAIESYRRSLQFSNDERWNGETVRRINRISQPSRQQRWWDARARLDVASSDGNAIAVRDIVALFPEHTRLAAEKEFLAAWARGALVGSTGESTKPLAIARNIGAERQKLLTDSLLADVVRAIDDSIRENDTSRIENLARGFLLYEQADTAATFDEAAEAFTIAGSAMANVARFHAIVTRFDATHIDRSLEQLRDLQRGTPGSHQILHAMIEGLIGDCLAERGSLEAALETYTQAQRAFESLGEADSVASMRTSAAHMLTLLGDPVEAWRVRRPALRMADASGNPTLVEFVLRQTASDERFNRGEWRGLAVYGSMLPMPPFYAAPGDEHLGSRWRNPVPLRSKQVMLDALNDRPLPTVVQNDLRIAQAISFYQRNPERAEALLSESIAFAEATGRVAMVPYVYFYRAMARCQVERGQASTLDRSVYYGAITPCGAKKEEDAIRDLTYAISLLEARRRETIRPDLRDLWYRTADDLFSELMGLHWDRGEDDAIFALGERLRGFAFLDGVTAATGALEPLPSKRIAERLPPGVAVIVFTASPNALPKHPLATIIERDRVEMHRLPIYTGNLYFRTRKLLVAIDEDRTDDVESIAEELYDLLIRPLKIDSGRIQRLVIVADDPLQDVPFSMFRDRESGQSLIEQFELMRAPSASVFAQTKEATLTPLRNVVAVGDPAFDRNAYPSFPSLPAARAEAVAIGRLYPQSRTLIGRHATLQNLATSVQTADVVHIAAHTVTNVEERESPKLLLAPSHQHAGACSVEEAADLPLRKGSIVVVPGCKTGSSREPGTLRDFAGSFLAAGARSVVATLWDVEDDPSRTFALFFHRALRGCGSAVTATREAQLAMLRSSNAGLRNPRAWSGFQVYGVGRENVPLDARSSQVPSTAVR